MAPLPAADSRSCRRITSAPLIMILQWIFILQHVWPAVYIMCRDVTRRSCDTLAQLWPAAVTLLPRDHCDVSHQYLGRPQDDAAEPRAYTTQTRGRGLLSHFRPGLGLTMNVMGDKNIFSNVKNCYMFENVFGTMEGTWNYNLKFVLYLIFHPPTKVNFNFAFQSVCFLTSLKLRADSWEWQGILEFKVFWGK